MANIADLVKNLVRERSQMVGQVRKLGKAISVLRKLATDKSRSVASKPAAKRRTMSAGARRKIAAAQRARWAKWKARQQKKAA